MNKTAFINELGKQLSYSPEKRIAINNVLENNFFISKKHKPEVVAQLTQQLNVDEVEATKIYDTAVKIVNDEVKRKIKHPFGRQD